jgi:hypothetical protein
LLSINTIKEVDNLIILISIASEVGTQTTLDGISVSKMVETVNILEDVLDKENSSLIQNHVNDKIKKITD